MGADERVSQAAPETRPDEEWRARQSEMEQWHKAAAAAPGELAAALEAEYRGRVLVGGGAGLAAMFLPREVD